MLDYSWEKLNSREFEIIACNYANDIFSKYIWKLTQPTKDDNHDFYALYKKSENWGEAKHSKNAKKVMSRAQWDPTIVSAKLINCVNEVLLVTCANIPLTYLVRSFHMINAPLEKVFYANRFLLNCWYNDTPKLRDLDSNFPIKNIENKILKRDLNLNIKNNLEIYFFDYIEKNFLTPINKLYINSAYELNIAIFISENEASISIPNNKYLKFITKISVINLSFPEKYIDIESNDNRSVLIKLKKGFNFIKSNIMIKQHNKLKGKIYFEVLLNEKVYKKSISICDTIKSEKNNIINFEKELNCNNSLQNKILNIEYLPLDKFKRYNKSYFLIRFDEREYYNYSKLCRMIVHMITNVDFYTLDESVLRKTIIKYDDYVMIEDFIVGIFDSLLAYECLNNDAKTVYLMQCFKTQQKSENYFYIIENASFLEGKSYNILKKLESNFILFKNQNVIIHQEYRCFTEKILKINDNVAKALFIEDGISLKYAGEINEYQNDELICKNIDNTLALPGYKIEIYQVIEYICSKNKKELLVFFDSLSYIINKQSWSNRTLDLLALINGRIEPELYLYVLRKIRDIYYSKTDFWNAYGYSKLINNLNTDSQIEVYIDDIYKEADELNHCGSITESRQKFKRVVDLIDNNNLNLYQLKKLEALTEIYNISFWLLDTKNLINAIKNTINEYFPNGILPNTPTRDQYPYYNCLNRKMVTEYLLELYDDAEKSFALCLKESKLQNYIAFAYMDSARGLYKKDIKTAYCRIEKAYHILSKLKCKGQELRRFYDCSVEKSYLEFILGNDSDKEFLINDLQDKIYDVKKHGYKSILKKCYFKLAACYLVLGDFKKAKSYLDIISSDIDFNKSPRNKLMYNSLNWGYFYLLNKQSGFYNYEVFKSINFNCFADDNTSSLYIETRLW